MASSVALQPVSTLAVDAESPPQVTRKILGFVRNSIHHNGVAGLMEEADVWGHLSTLLKQLSDCSSSPPASHLKWWNDLVTMSVGAKDKTPHLKHIFVVISPGFDNDEKPVADTVMGRTLHALQDQDILILGRKKTNPHFQRLCKALELDPATMYDGLPDLASSEHLVVGRPDLLTKVFKPMMRKPFQLKVKHDGESVKTVDLRLMLPKSFPYEVEHNMVTISYLEGTLTTRMAFYLSKRPGVLPSEYALARIEDTASYKALEPFLGKLYQKNQVLLAMAKGDGQNTRRLCMEIGLYAPKASDVPRPFCLVMRSQHNTFLDPLVRETTKFYFSQLNLSTVEVMKHVNDNLDNLANTCEETGNPAKRPKITKTPETAKATSA